MWGSRPEPDGAVGAQVGDRPEEVEVAAEGPACLGGHERDVVVAGGGELVVAGVPDEGLLHGGEQVLLRDGRREAGLPDLREVAEVEVAVVLQAVAQRHADARVGGPGERGPRLRLELPVAGEPVETEAGGGGERDVVPDERREGEGLVQLSDRGDRVVDLAAHVHGLGHVHRRGHAAGGLHFPTPEPLQRVVVLVDGGEGELLGVGLDVEAGAKRELAAGPAAQADLHRHFPRVGVRQVGHDLDERVNAEAVEPLPCGEEPTGPKALTGLELGLQLDSPEVARFLAGEGDRADDAGATGHHHVADAGLVLLGLNVHGPGDLRVGVAAFAEAPLDGLQPVGVVLQREDIALPHADGADHALTKRAGEGFEPFDLRGAGEAGGLAADDVPHEVHALHAGSAGPQARQALPPIEAGVEPAVVGVPGLDAPRVLREHHVVHQPDVADVTEEVESSGQVDHAPRRAGVDAVGEHARAVPGEGTPTIALEAEIFHDDLTERDRRFGATHEQEQDGEHGIDGIGTRPCLPFH